MDYTGYIYREFSSEELSEFYNRLKEPEFCDSFGLFENQYLIISHNGEVVDKYCFRNHEFIKVNYSSIETRQLGKIKPRNLEQELAFELLKNREVPVKLIKGVYGSGKDFCMLSEALSLVEKGIFQKIIFIRPNVTVADVPEIGYLKGTESEKLAWTLAPFYDKVGGEDGVYDLINRGMLESVPLLFLRGRSFENSIVYVCEGQNITSEIAKLIISRLGKDSELWINSDTHQVDRKIYKQDNGINKMIERLHGHRLFGMVYLPKTERGEIAELASLLDD